MPLSLVCSVDELTQAFSLDRITKSAAVFDKVKLNWMNGQHLRCVCVCGGGVLWTRVYHGKCGVHGCVDTRGAVSTAILHGCSICSFCNPSTAQLVYASLI
jgi:hypothetical protein